jgi:hypothetical protein
MKPYGVKVIEWPDVGDIQSMGAKSSTGKFAGKSGDYHSYSKGNSKKRIRRYWKRKARKEKVEIDEC